MPYLGPKSFKTTPLTSSNLAYLNEPTIHSIDNTSHNTSTKTNITSTNNTNNTDNTNTNNNNIIINRDNYQLINNNNNNNNNNTDIDKNQMKIFIPQENETIINSILNSNTITDSSSNSLSGFSTLSYNNKSSKSSETSLNSLAESQSHKTLIDLNDEDNKTIIYSNNNETELIIPSSPLKNYDLVSVSSNNSTNSLNVVDKLPLLRKKSGELVKSSLKLDTLSRSNSMPNAKSVRFAATLENVKFFNKSERPTAVSMNKFNKHLRTQWDFDNSSSSSTTSSDDDDDDDDADNNLNELNEDYDNFLNNEFSTSEWLIKANDCPYNPFSLNFAKLATNNDVILESVKLNSSGNSLIGFVYAKNIAFEKKIIVKLTFDNWNSFIEIENSNYISSNHIFKYSDSNSNIYDKFSFIIKLDNLNVFSNYLNLEFCIQYVANDYSYWDNNNGKNYKISLQKNIKNSKNNSDILPIPKINSNVNKSNNYLKSFDIEDTNIKLKDNNNFKNDFSNSKPLNDINSLRTSNSYGLKKIRSESSIPTMKSDFKFGNNNFIPTYHKNKSNSIINTKIDDLNLTSSSSSQACIYTNTNANANINTNNNKKYVSKSLSASPALKSNGFDSNPINLNDYDHIIKKFCFFTTADKSDNPSLLRLEDYNQIDNNNFSKTQTSMFVE